MKKGIALILAVIMILTGTLALAETAQQKTQTAYVQLSVDGEAAKTVLTAFGVQEEQMATISPVLALLGNLGVKITSGDSGVQVDLDLDGTEMLSLGGAMTEEGLKLGSSLFPNYLISASAETLQGMMQQFMPMMAAGAATGGETGTDMNAAFAAFQKYTAPFTEAVQTAMVPGEAEQGEFEIDGYTYDIRTPMTVDVPAMAEAGKKMLTDMLNDPEAAALFQSVPNFNAEEVLKNYEAAMSEENLPDVKVDIYTMSDGSDLYYTISEATYKGKEEPSYRYTMQNKGDGDGTIGFWAFDMQTIVGVSYSRSGFIMDCTTGELWFGLQVETGEALLADLYVMDTEKPLLSLKITVSEAAERTLSLDPEGRSVVTLEEIMGGNGSEAAAGLVKDIQTNLILLLSKVVKAVPEAQNLMMLLMSPSTGGQNGTAEKTQPEKTVPAEVDTSAWKTLGDVLALETEEGMERGTEGMDCYTATFKYGGRTWLVAVDFSEELFQQLMDAHFDDEKEMEILGPLEVRKVIELSALGLAREELDQWIGKTGQDLLDAGWEYNGYSDYGDGPIPHMINGQFEYAVTFTKALTPSQTFGEMPEDFAAGEISGIEFYGKSYHFDAAEWLNK